MNAIERLRAHMAQRKAITAGEKKPKGTPSLSELAKGIRAKREEQTAWRKPSNPADVHSVSLPIGCNVARLLAHARASFPRLNVREVKPGIVHIEGKAEARWLASFAERF